jgi:2-polyprenyl-3-methyl-5-hydroxy-6-metoxy-1,4-benzoquinol methylase
MLSPSLRRKIVRRSRTALQKGLRNSSVRRAAERTVNELNRALTESGVYGGAYFGDGRNPLDRMGLSGYERYDRDTSNANAIALPVWHYFESEKSLDVGCATGFVVEALSELGFNAWGTDLSFWAVEHAAQGAKGRLRQGDLMEGLPFANGEFDVVTCLEVLEHMEPGMIPAVLSEIRRVCSKYVVATIPSFGDNQYGPGGWFDVKVRPEKLDEYRAKVGYEGPIPYDDIYRDASGEPIEGHLTMASFSWWQKQFEAAGFIRCGETELLMHRDLAKYAQTEYWNLYVFRTPDAPEPTHAVRTPDEVAHWEHNFKLDAREQRLRDYERLNEALLRNGKTPVALPQGVS